MSEAEEHSLVDDEIQTDFRSDPNFFRIVMREVVGLDDRLKDVADGEMVPVPVESLRTIQMGVMAIAKAESEIEGGPRFLHPFGDSFDHGNQGPGCDYNPFKKINTGDLIG